MEMTRLWFGFRGRLNRAKYWLVTTLNVIAMFILFLIVFGTQSWIAVAIALTALIPFLISGLAVAVKRLHDRNKSAWWLLFFYFLPVALDGMRDALAKIQEVTASVLSFACIVVSLVISIWALIELGFLRGTPGENQFGPDPLAAQGS